MNPIDKLIRDLTKRLDTYFPTVSTNYDRIMESRVAKLGEERAKNSFYTGYKAYEDAWVNMTQEEISYYRSKITPEERYQTIKEMYYFHETSSYMTGDSSPDRYGCNADACISECDFYPEYRSDR